MKAKFVTYTPKSYSEEELINRSEEHFNYINERRTVRDFSTKTIPLVVIENIIKSASSAPSGAHKQPWTFCVVTNKELKSKIRVAAEAEEYKSYNERMPKEWLEDLSYLGTDWHKPFLEEAPVLIIVFKKKYDLQDGIKRSNYYVNESVGLACGFLLEAIHYSGLVALTHTPSPMDFLIDLLKRPINEKPFLLIPVGYPAENTLVPDLKRKDSKDVIEYYI